MDRSPAPAPSPLTEPYWEACRRGELALQRCAGCGRFVHFPEPVCPFCGGTELPYTKVSGQGTVHTFSVVERTFLAGFRTPYVIAWIDLTEGARVFGGLVGHPPWDVRIGMPVETCFVDLPGFGPIPYFTPVATPRLIPGPEVGSHDLPATPGDPAGDPFVSYPTRVRHATRVPDQTRVPNATRT
jgi:uncharacterized OB-fold protein